MRNARIGTPSRVRGLNSFTSPIIFIARVTHISPTVPTTTMKKTRITSISIDRLRGARRRVTDNQHAEANDRDARPPQGRYGLTQDKSAEQRSNPGCECGSRLHVAIVRPREDNRVGNEEADHRES